MEVESDDVLALVIGAENSIRDANTKLRLAAELAAKTGWLEADERLTWHAAGAFDLAEDIRADRTARRFSR